MQALGASCLSRVMVALLVAPVALAQSAEVDTLVTAELERQRIPGLSIAVVRDGKVVKAQGYGLANVEHGVAASAETITKRAPSVSRSRPRW